MRPRFPVQRDEGYEITVEALDQEAAVVVPCPSALHLDSTRGPLLQPSCDDVVAGVVRVRFEGLDAIDWELAKDKQLGTG